MMTLKNISFIVVAVGVIIGWNAFLIQRDDALYKSYYRQQAIENLKHPPSTEIR
jgi:heme/copper-type cytochrome/quinol oxidase subunit 1